VHEGALVAAQAVENFGWYFPQCPSVRRLAQAARDLSAAHLDAIESATADHEWLRRELVSRLAPAVAACWWRNRIDQPGVRGLLDTALALVGRRCLPWGAILWPEFEALTLPVASLPPLSWVVTDASVTRIAAARERAGALRPTGSW
jgi:glutathione S-transferase